MKDYFDNRINNIRAIAILIVLLGHSIIIYSPEWGIYVSSVSCNFFAWLKRLINIIQMPVFFSISGFLFKSSLMKRKPSRIVKSKVSRLILPYLMIGLFYMIPIRLLAKYPAWEGKALWKILFFDLILGYDNGHLWYLYVLFFFFLFGAIFRKLNRAVTACFFLFVLSLLSIFKPFSSLHPLLYQFENNFVWFYLGYLFSFYSEAFNTFHNRSYFFFLVFVLLIVVNLLALKTGMAFAVFFSSFAWVALFFFFMPGKNSLALSAVAKNSFGMYLFHSPLVYLTFSFLPDIHPALILAINFVLFGTVSYLLVNLLRFLNMSFVIGEGFTKPHNKVL